MDERGSERVRCACHPDRPRPGKEIARHASDMRYTSKGARRARTKTLVKCAASLARIALVSSAVQPKAEWDLGSQHGLHGLTHQRVLGWTVVNKACN